MSTAVTSLISLTVMLVIAFTALGSIFSVMSATGDAQTTQLEDTHAVLRSDVVASAAATSTRLDGHSDVDVTLANAGALSYTSYSRWDVNAHYTHIDGSNEGVWLPYATSLADDSWIVQQIYLDADTSTLEMLEPGVLNPEEEALIRIRLAPPAEPGTTGWIIITPPEGPPTNISFVSPSSLHVVDDDDRTVYLYDRDGTYQGSYSLDAQTGDARGITVHAHSFYVVDTGDDETYRYAAGFSLLGSWEHTSGNTSSQGITTDGSSSWVVDGRDDSVYKYDLDGGFISETPLRSGNRAATGITTDGTFIWVTDSGDDSVYKYDMELVFISELPLAAGNTAPVGITTNGTRIWVVDGIDLSIYVYDMDMNPVSVFALVAANADPTGITVAPR